MVEQVTFPNGFRNYMETYFEVVAFITLEVSKDDYNPEEQRNKIELTQDEEGTSALYDLAEKWTADFEVMNRGREWDGSFIDEIWDYCRMKNRIESHRQLELVEEIKSKLNINIVTCGHCGEAFLHMRDEYELLCPHCDTLMDASDCPDLFWRYEN